jgi:hypothetical protein
LTPITVFFTYQEKQHLPPGRYYIGVRVKIPTVIVSGDDNIVPTIPPTLDPQNSSQHSHPNVVASETHLVIFDITEHPHCPMERTIAAADQFLADHYFEFDRVLREYLRNHYGA